MTDALTALRARVRRRLVGLASEAPPRWILAALRALAHGVDLARLGTAQRAADALGLEGRERARWCRDTWCGAKLDEVLSARLKRRPGDINALVAQVDLADLERRATRGAIVAAVHIGPQHVAALTIHERFPETLFLLRERQVLPAAAVILIDDDANRAAALVEARRHLRAGGLVYVAPDGISGTLSLELPLCGGVVDLGRGAAALARLSGVPAFPVTSALVGGAIEVRCGPAIMPPSMPPEDWERAWSLAYLAHVERWTRTLPAENLRLHGSIFARWRRTG